MSLHNCVEVISVAPPVLSAGRRSTGGIPVQFASLFDVCSLRLGDHVSMSLLVSQVVSVILSLVLSRSTCRRSNSGSRAAESCCRVVSDRS